MKRIWGLASSVWTGIFLLLNLAGLAVFITVRYEGPEAYFLHPLYLGLLGAFGLNIACVLISRYRFKRAQTGFLMTHVGIVTALVGGALTHWGGEDGQMQIAEGSAASAFLVERTAGLYKARELRVATRGGARNTRAFDVAPPARLPDYGIDGDALRVRVLDYLPHAARERQAEPVADASPAIRFHVGMAVASMEDWLSADDPDFGTREVGNGLSVHYRRGRAEEVLPEDKSLTFVEAEDGSLALVESDGKGRHAVHAGMVPGGNAVSCTLSPLKASVLSHLPSAVVIPGYSASPRGEEEVVRLLLTSGGESRAVWASWGEPVSVPLGGEQVFILFSNPREDLGFTLRLDRFQKQDYEGSAIPMSFESHVRLEDPEEGIQGEPFNIHMNAPLIHRGWTFFQAAFSPPERPGAPQTTVLQVSRDPGKPVVYTGAVLIVSGVVFMFYLKPWMKKRGML